jgi:excisionase family DNA binding protein
MQTQHVHAANADAPQASKVLMTVDEACAALGIGRTHLYSFLSRGELVSLKVGGRRLVPVRALHEFVDRLVTLQKVS